MTITAAQVKELRDLTGAGMMDAKKALTETDGDMEKAQELLRQKGIATAEKKSGRTAADGQIVAQVSDDGKSGAMIEVNCETDFVARGDQFQALAGNLVAQVLADLPTSLEGFLSSTAASFPSGTVKDYITESIATIKENIGFRRFVTYSLSGNGAVKSYIHTGGRIGVLLKLTAEKAEAASSEAFQTLAKDITLHIASAAPEYVSRTEIPQSVIDQETRIEMGKEDIQNKPEEIREKIVVGRVNKLMGERVLLEQPFVKDPNMTIEQLVEAKSKELGDTIGVEAFTRYMLGEGIEKEETDFAAEVAAAAKA